MIENAFLRRIPESIWSVANRIAKGEEDIDPEHYIVIDLWSNDDREPDIIGGDDKCPHQNVQFRHCLHCGAFIAHVGEEVKWDLYWKHILMISNTLKDYKFMIISHKEIPSYVRGMTVMSQRLKFPHSRHNIFFPKDGKYAMVFDHKEDALSKYSLTIKSENIYSYLFRSYRAGAIVNPTKKVLQFKIQIPTFTSNKGTSL